MFQSPALLSLFFIASSAVSAVPINNPNIFSVPISGKFGSTGYGTIADADRARAASLWSGSRANATTKRDGNANVPATNANALSYVVSVGIGSPPVQYDLIVDTGSSNTWVGAEKPYIPTSTSYDTGDTVSVTYGSGSFSGEEYTDQVTLASNLVIHGQSIGVASTSKGLGRVDGILGLGPTDLTAGTISNVGTVPTVTDNLFSQGSISSNVLGVYFEPATSISADLSGELTFGGVDNSKTVGAVNYVPITSTSPSSRYWGIDQSVSYGGSTILDTTAGIVDTGTTLVHIASDAFQKYKEATGATLNQSTGLLEISSENFSKLQSLFFVVGGVSYELTPNAQIRPRALNSAEGRDVGSIHLIVVDLGRPSGQGLDFINGIAFLERYYSVYDTANQRVGFAATPYTNATSN